MNNNKQRAQLEATLLSHWRSFILKNYMGCGYPDEDWFNTALAKHFPALDSLTDDELSQRLEEYATSATN